MVGLFAAHHSQLLSYAMLTVPDAALAQDVVQEAFLVLHARYGKLRDPLPYLYKVIQNQARAEWRRRAIERPDPYAADLASPPVPSFEDQVVANSEAGSLARILASAVRQLSPRQREVLTLTMSGCSPGEVARRLGLPANAVRVHLHHARGKVRARLEAAGIRVA